MESLIYQGVSATGQIGLATVCGWFMFRLERILTKLTETVAQCPHRK